MEYEPASFPVLDAKEAVRCAREYLEEETPQQAAGALGKLTDLFPQEPLLWHLRGVAAQEAGRCREAEDAYRRALRLDPAFCDCALDLVDLLLDDGRVEEAGALAGDVVEQQPPRARALGLLGETRALLGRTGEARQFFRRALAVDPSFAWAGRNLADLLLEEGRVDEAHALTVELLDRDPLDAYTHAYLGEILERRGLEDAALASLRTALWLRPGYGWAARRAAAVLCRRGDTLEAAVTLRRALHACPDDDLVLASLGCLETKLGCTDAAEQCFRRALELRPDSSEAFSGLFGLLLETDRGADAHALLCRRLGAGVEEAPCTVSGGVRRRLEAG